MGDSASRRPPPDAHGTGEASKATETEPEQEPQAQPDPHPAADPAKEEGPRSKFHGSDPRKH